MSIVVTAVDTETGEQSSITVERGNYVIVAVDPCRLVDEQHHLSGTTVLTLRGRDPRYMATAFVEPIGGAHSG